MMLNIVLKFMLSLFKYLSRPARIISLNYDCNIAVVGASFDVQSTQNIYIYRYIFINISYSFVNSFNSLLNFAFSFRQAERIINTLDESG